jgi:hypothetical protein
MNETSPTDVGPLSEATRTVVPEFVEAVAVVVAASVVDAVSEEDPPQPTRARTPTTRQLMTAARKGLLMGCLRRVKRYSPFFAR